MTGRDRLVVLVLVALGLVGASWWFIVAPERQQAAKADQQLLADNQARDGVLGQVAQARAAVAGYATTKTALGAIDRAVPTTGDVSDLIRQLATTAGAKHVDFRVISLTPATPGSGAPAAAAAPAPAAASAPAAATGAAGTTAGSAPFTGAASSPALASAATINTLTFSFTFVGGYLDLERFLRAVNAYAAADSAGLLKSSGRLLSVKSVTLAPFAGTGSASSGGATGPQASITAEAYVLASPPVAVPAAPNGLGAPVLGSAAPGRTRIPGTVLPAPARRLLPLPGTPGPQTPARRPAAVPAHAPEAALVQPAGQAAHPAPTANAARAVGGTR